MTFAIGLTVKLTETSRIALSTHPQLPSDDLVIVNSFRLGAT